MRHLNVSKSIFQNIVLDLLLFRSVVIVVIVVILVIVVIGYFRFFH